MQYAVENFDFEREKHMHDFLPWKYKQPRLCDSTGIEKNPQYVLWIAAKINPIWILGLKTGHIKIHVSCHELGEGASCVYIPSKKKD